MKLKSRGLQAYFATHIGFETISAIIAIRKKQKLNTIGQKVFSPPPVQQTPKQNIFSNNLLLTQGLARQKMNIHVDKTSIQRFK